MIVVVMNRLQREGRNNQHQWKEDCHINMAAIPRCAKLVACLLNVSEARNYNILRDIAEAALKDQEKWKPSKFDHTKEDNCINTESVGHFKTKATVLNIFADYEYNRSVITLASSIEYLEQCLFQACIEAFDKIDLRNQDGGHPRLGAVDLIPIHPLNSSVSLAECGQVGRKLGDRIINSIPGTSAFFFGAADSPLQRGIVQRRKEVNWYSGRHGATLTDAKWDIGERPSSRYGIVGIGAMPYMTNFNITIDTDDMNIGNDIAKDIRQTSPNGLKGVQSMAFCHDEKIEIACNVETLDLQLGETYTGPKYATFKEIEDIVKRLCHEKGISVSGTALIGFQPEEAFERTVQDLTEGIFSHLKKFDNTRM